MRRLTAVLAVVALAATASCGDGGSEDRTGDAGGADPTTTTAVAALPACPVDALDEADGTVDIDLWHGLSGESQQFLVALGDRYNASQDRVHVEIQDQGVSFDEVLAKYTAGIPSGQLPAIAYLEDMALRQLVDSDTVLPAEACEVADDLDAGQLPAVRSYYTADGVFWPGYVNVSAPVLYYNANHFVRAGLDPDDPPDTLAEVRAAAEAIAEAGIAETPVAMSLKPWFVENWVAGAGEQVLDHDDGRDGRATAATYDTPATHEAYEWLDGMADDGLLAGFSDTDGQIDHYLALVQQNASMLFETTTAATTIQSVLGGQDAGVVPGVDTGSVDLTGIAPQAGPFPGLDEPGRIRISGAAFYMTNTGSDLEQAAAWDFMRYMRSVENQVGWHLEGSYLPTTQEAATAPEVTEYWEGGGLAGELLKVGYDELVAVDADRPGPQVGPYVDYLDAIRASLEDVVLGGGSPDEAIATAQEQIDAALAASEEDGG